MSESVKPRFAVDLDDIERQLASAQSTPPTASPSRNDPLAELARIVGQDDPFQDILSRGRPAARGHAPADLDDIFASRAPEQYARPGISGTQPYPAPMPPDDQPESFSTSDYSAPDYAASHSADGAYAEPYGYDADVDEPISRQPARSRKGLVAAGALLGAVALVGGGYWMLGQGTGTFSSGGEPPLVKASQEPVKVEPQTPGGVEIPHQNKEIYGAAQDGKTHVVNREEQPVDVQQAVRDAQGASAESTGATTISAPAGNGLNLGEPKRVRTITIRPDGTPVTDEPAAPRRASSTQPPATALPATAQNAPATGRSAQAHQAPPAQPAPPPASATPRATASSSAGGAPTQNPAPAPQRVASADPTALAMASPPAASAPAPSGGFAVQLAVRTTEAEARSAFPGLQQKYAELATLSPIIRKAEVNGNTIYRLRVGPMSRDDASSLCSRIQGQGGQCFVAKN
jgi:hypothetical protein